MMAIAPLWRCSAVALTLLALASQPWLPGAADGCPAGSSAICQSSEDDAAGALGLLQFDASHLAPSQEGASGASGARADGAGKLSAANAGRLGLHVSQGLGISARADPELSCAEYPTLCEAPFNCNSNPPTAAEQARWANVSLATEDGHPDLRSWCNAPQYEATLIKHCLKEHDLRTSAQAVFDWTVAEGIDQLDASYCFMEGHCVNMNVTYDTTLEEAEALCDTRYGHESWTSVKFGDLAIQLSRHPFGQSSETGFHTRDITSVFGLFACAQGNFHCDVIYCRDTYCKKPEYVEKYGHYLKDYGYIS